MVQCAHGHGVLTKAPSVQGASHQVDAYWGEVYVFFLWHASCTDARNVLAGVAEGPPRHSPHHAPVDVVRDQDVVGEFLQGRG